MLLSPQCVGRQLKFKNMKSKITVTGSPLDGYGTWIDELLSVGGNRASKPIIMPRKFVTIEELVEMEYNPDFIKNVVNREAGESHQP